MNYLQTISDSHDLRITAAQLCDDVLGISERDFPPSSWVALLDRVKQACLARDRSLEPRWSVVSSGEVWFESSVIEVLPRYPSGVFSELLVRSLSSILDEVWRESSESNYEALFNFLLCDDEYFTSSVDEKLQRQWLAFVIILLDRRPFCRDFIYSKPWPAHKDPAIRALVLSFAYIDYPWGLAQEYIHSSIHDTDETVFVTAFRMCARTLDDRALDHLLEIVPNPSAVLDGLKNNKMAYPVGQAACSICPAQFLILGTDVPEIAASRECSAKLRSTSPSASAIESSRSKLFRAIAEFEYPHVPLGSSPALDTMVRIPAGPFTMGLPHELVESHPFDMSSCSPQVTRMLDEFYIDKYPVTNKEYDEWVREFESLSTVEQSRYLHPGHPKWKVSHGRNTEFDLRFGENHPVVGIDWFDAWAFANYQGKSLPSEEQWEKTARGSNQTLFPWGDDFDHTAAHYILHSYGFEPSTVSEWVVALHNSSHSHPSITTLPVDSHPEGQSSFGVHDMCGNCWEYTNTSFFSRQEPRAAFSDFKPIEIVGSRDSQVVIRGGAWSSPRWMLSGAYRGYDLLTDRHTEIGFRCVWNPRRGN